MTPIEARKQLLVAEANLLRLQAISEINGISDSVASSSRQPSSTASVISACSSIASILFLRTPSSGPAGKVRQMLPAVLDSLRLGVDLWVAFRRR
jgi:hypothetical protein